MNGSPQQIRPPQQVFDSDNLPDDLKWIMSHFGLPKNDPAVVLIAWHWYRVLNNQDAIHAGAMELKAVLDPRLDKIVGFLAQDDAALKSKVEGWAKPIGQVAQSLESVVRNIDRRWPQQTWQHHVACILGGMAAGSLVTLCAFLH